jgi:hypothetical protein
MTPLFVALLASLRATIRCRLELAAEMLALRRAFRARRGRITSDTWWRP